MRGPGDDDAPLVVVLLELSVLRKHAPDGGAEAGALPLQGQRGEHARPALVARFQGAHQARVRDDEVRSCTGDQACQASVGGQELLMRRSLPRARLFSKMKELPKITRSRIAHPRLKDVRQHRTRGFRHAKPGKLPEERHGDQKKAPRSRNTA